MQYKHLLAEINFSAPTNCFYGEVTNLYSSAIAKDTIVFLASNQFDLPNALKQAVKQYVAVGKKNSIHLSHAT